MAASTNDVLRQIDGSWRELQSALAEVPGDRMEEPGVVGHWSTKDLLGHVTTWEVEMMANVQRVVDGLEMKRYPEVDTFKADALSPPARAQGLAPGGHIPSTGSGQALQTPCQSGLPPLDSPGRILR